MVRAENADQPRVIDDVHADVARGRTTLKQREQIRRRLFPPINLSRLQRGGGGAGIRDDQPFHAIKMRDLAAGGHGGCFLARHVIRVARIGEARSGDPFILDEAIGAAADGFRDIREGVHIGQPFRHDEQAACGDLRQTIEHFREGCV